MTLSQCDEIRLLKESHRNEIAKLRKEHRFQLEMSQVDPVAESYIDAILSKAQRMRSFQTYESMQALIAEINQLKVQKEQQTMNH